MKIKLTTGEFALVDSDVYSLVTKYNWYITGDKRYACSTINYKYVLMHRFILTAKNGQNIDHKNGNGLDNRKKNLRFCSQKENTRNKIKSSLNTSGYKGVYKNGNKWRARIKVNGILIHLGSFIYKKDAAVAYNVGAKKYFKKFARLNNVQGN